MKRVSFLFLAFVSGCAIQVATLDELVDKKRAGEKSCYEVRTNDTGAALVGFALLGPLGALLGPAIADHPLKCGLTLNTAISEAYTMAYFDTSRVTLRNKSPNNRITVQIDDVTAIKDCMLAQVVISTRDNDLLRRHKRPIKVCKDPEGRPVEVAISTSEVKQLQLTNAYTDDE